MRAILCASLLMTFSSGALAQDPADAVIELAPTEVTGTPQRPGAFYITQRSRARTELAELRTSFVHRVVESARRAPLAD